MGSCVINNFKLKEFEFLSNFYPCKIVVNGVEYPSVEHAFQSEKTVLDFEKEAIRLAKNPAIAKKLGKKVCLRSGWEENKVSIMENLVRQKFENPVLAKKLQKTKGLKLEESNSWGDYFWGTCGGTGKNMLGKILMKIRDFE